VKETVSRFSHEAQAARCPVQVIHTGPVTGNWDRMRCEQVLVNLLSNAIKYAPRSPIQIKVEARDDLARLEFRDFGPGIPKEKQERIFERYERVTNVRHTAGLGLGLFIVRQIIQAHHGKIWVESPAGPAPGVAFIVELPLQYAPEEKPLQPAKAAQA
jgi:signal transduction histidine kinase